MLFSWEIGVFDAAIDDKVMAGLGHKEVAQVEELTGSKKPIVG